MNVAQPSISASIRGLESEFGVNLFRRVKQQLILTNEGSFLLKYANEILESADSLEQKMLELGRDRKYLRIAVPPLTGTFAFNDLYFAYRRRFPEADLEILESGSTRNLAAVADESVDLALATTGPIVNDQLNILPISPARIVLCVPKRHRLAGEPEIRFEMLRDEPVTLWRKGSKYNDFVEQRFADIGLKPKVLLYSSQMYTIRRFVSEGIACAFCFEGVGRLFEDAVMIPVPDLPVQTVDLVWKKAKYLNNRERYLFHDVEQFVSFARDFTVRSSAGSAP